MRRLILLALAGVLAVTAVPSAQQAGPLQAAATALGVANVKSLQFTGSGQVFQVGQNFLATDPWPALTVKSYVASINFDTISMRQEILREQPNPVMPRGGGAPFMGEQRQMLLVSGDYAWNMPVAAPPAPPAAAEAGRVTLPQALQAAGVRPAAPAAPQPQPNAGAQPERMLFVLATPQGFVKAAMANNATTRNRSGNTEVSFTAGGKYKMVGTINPQGQVTKVQTWIDNPIVGDMLVETNYSGYRDFGGVMFPAKIVQSQDGFPSLDLTISAVTANPAVDIAVPDAVRSAPPPAAPMVMSTPMGEGVYYLTGGTHHSLAVEMKDHIVVVDLPNNQARAAAVLAKAKELISNKPVKFVVTSHHHWDHLSGIREGIAEGATIVTHQSNKSFIERVAKTPHTLGPDRQAQTKKGAKVQAVADLARLTDGTRVIELHLMKDFTHTGDLLMVYLPKEKVLFEPDAFTPPAQAGAALAPPAAVFSKTLYDNIQRLKLDVTTIAPFHGNRTTNVAEIARAGGVNATN